MCKSIATDCLLCAIVGHQRLTPSFISPQRLIGSPTPGGSILIYFASGVTHQLASEGSGDEAPELQHAEGRERTGRDAVLSRHSLVPVRAWAGHSVRHERLGGHSNPLCATDIVSWHVELCLPATEKESRGSLMRTTVAYNHAEGSEPSSLSIGVRWHARPLIAYQIGLGEAMPRSSLIEGEARQSCRSQWPGQSRLRLGRPARRSFVLSLSRYEFRHAHEPAGPITRGDEFSASGRRSRPSRQR